MHLCSGMLSAKSMGSAIVESMMKRVPLTIAVLVVAAGLPNTVFGGRAFTPEDLFRLETFGAVVASPDERLLAIVRVRRKSNLRIYMRDFMDGRDRSDVWIHDLTTGRQIHVANGEKDGAGFFAPVWSPDGQNLALLSTRNDNITLWVWHRGSRKLRQVSDQTVGLDAPVWLSGTEIVCPAPPDGQKPLLFDLEVRAANKATELWPKAWAGDHPTASVLYSGSDLPAPHPPLGRLLKFDLANGRPTTISRGNYTGISSSIQHRSIAAFELVETVTPEPGKRLPNRNPSMYRLVVFQGSARQTVVDLGREEVVPVPVIWLPDGSLVTRVTGTSGRADWYVVKPSGERANLTSHLTSVPSTLIRRPGTSELLAVAGGNLMRLSLDGSRPEVVLENGGATIDAIVAPESGAIVVRARESGRTGLYLVDFDRRGLRSVPQPSTSAELLAFLPKSSTAVFRGEDETGTSVWSMRTSGSHARTVAKANEFVADVSAGHWRQFKYSSSSGRELTAWLLLPPNYVEGRRYPTVVSAYPGLLYSDSFRPRDDLQRSNAFNKQLLAARGYAVLFPSIPLSPEGEPGDPLPQTLDGVMPAVDEAVKLGIADADRLALMGHSFGAYGVAALLTQTSRFKVAVAISGFVNLTSLYGQFDARARYEETARNRLIHMVFAESGQFRMGAPPWEDLDRYIRNSPISRADRVTTPVMIVQGDMDYVPIQQGEEFFTALFRQNKAALFVRYWGEGHILESPANIKDFWDRVYDWLKRYVD